MVFCIFSIVDVSASCEKDQRQITSYRDAQSEEEYVNTYVAERQPPFPQFSYPADNVCWEVVEISGWKKIIFKENQNHNNEKTNCWYLDVGETLCSFLKSTITTRVASCSSSGSMLPGSPMRRVKQRVMRVNSIHILSAIFNCSPPG